MSAKAQRSIKASRGDLVFSIINYLFLILLSLLVLYPLIYVLSSSFSSPQAVTTGKVWLYPVEPTLVGYKQVFKNPNVLRGYWNCWPTPCRSGILRGGSSLPPSSPLPCCSTAAWSPPLSW